MPESDEKVVRRHLILLLRSFKGGRKEKYRTDKMAYLTADVCASPIALRKKRLSINLAVPGSGSPLVV